MTDVFFTIAFERVQEAGGIIVRRIPRLPRQHKITGSSGIKIGFPLHCAQRHLCTQPFFPFGRPTLSRSFHADRTCCRTAQSVADERRRIPLSQQDFCHRDALTIGFCSSSNVVALKPFTSGGVSVVAGVLNPPSTFCAISCRSTVRYSARRTRTSLNGGFSSLKL